MCVWGGGWTPGGIRQKVDRIASGSEPVTPDTTNTCRHFSKWKGGGQGVKPPITAQGPGIFVLSKGTKGGSLTDPLNIKISSMNCFKLLSITRNKTCYTFAINKYK